MLLRSMLPNIIHREKTQVNSENCGYQLDTTLSLVSFYAPSKVITSLLRYCGWHSLSVQSYYKE